MRTIYIDSDYKCHAAAADNLKATETAAFDGKCDAFVEGYRLVPSSETWVRSDGVEFQGEMIAPWKDYAELDEAQRAYEQELLAEYESALSAIEAALGV